MRTNATNLPYPPGPQLGIQKNYGVFSHPALPRQAAICLGMKRKYLIIPGMIATIALLNGCGHRTVYVEKSTTVTEPRHTETVIVPERHTETVVVPERAPATETVVVQEAPPKLRIEEPPQSPGPGYTWISGYWGWNGQWTWVPGRWTMRPGSYDRWEPGHWDRRGHSYVWIPGRWR